MTVLVAGSNVAAGHVLSVQRLEVWQQCCRRTLVSKLIFRTILFQTNQSRMTTVAVRLEWAGAAEEVLVAGEFNGWAKVPLVKEQVEPSSVKILYLAFSYAFTLTFILAFILTFILALPPPSPSPAGAALGVGAASGARLLHLQVDHSHPLTISPPHPLTPSPSHPLTHPLTLSPSHPLTLSPSNPLTLSPPHPLTPPITLPGPTLPGPGKGAY